MVQPVAPLTQYATLTRSGVPTLDTDFLEVGAGAMCFAGVATGSANSLVATIPLALPDYYLGMELDLIPSVNNTGPPVVSVATPQGTLPPIAITDQSGIAIGANVLVAGSLVRLKLCQLTSGVYGFRVAAVSAPVTSVFGRTGPVAAQTGDYSLAQITGAGTMASQASTAVSITGGTMSGVSMTAMTGPQVPKAWVYSNGSGVVQASYNVSSVTRTGTGAYTITLTAGAVPDAVYAPALTCAGVSAPYSINFDPTSLATTGFNIVIRNANTAVTDQFFAAFVYHA